MPEPALDRLDLALLRLVQRDNQLPARMLAEKAGLSESAALRRLRRLRREGVIAADVSVVRPAAVGLPLTVVALVSLEREGAAELDAFARRVRACPQVRHCWYVTGEADWVLVLRLASMEAYEALTRALFLADSNVRGFRTLVAMREVVGEADARPLETQEGA
ncbi:MAG TPA: Lrp/AsnC family transcriptional regulator [Acetobacteraceae bacterium]|nr:Lrp/AsnC family transcriptional regulator [Acetobacteraceae bacterium]